MAKYIFYILIGKIYNFHCKEIYGNRYNGNGGAGDHGKTFQNDTVIYFFERADQFRLKNIY